MKAHETIISMVVAACFLTWQNIMHDHALPTAKQDMHRVIQHVSSRKHQLDATTVAKLDTKGLRKVTEEAPQSAEYIHHQHRLKQFVDCKARDNLKELGRPTSKVEEVSEMRHSFEQKPCALLFFGLAKHFREIVLPSIQKYIISVSGQQCDIFIHNYNITTVTNERNDEDEEVLDPTEVMDLTPHVMLENLDDFERKRNMTYLGQRRFQVNKKHGWSGAAFPNMIKQWHSIEQVWNMMQVYEAKENIEYDRIGFFRSDVVYQTPINIFKGDAVIPAFGMLGRNDRMFYGKYELAHIWANIRFPSVECYVPRASTHGLHSEFFMANHILLNIPNITFDRDICFNRVRANGHVKKHDCDWTPERYRPDQPIPMYD